jgi:hypothetical protein
MELLKEIQCQLFQPVDLPAFSLTLGVLDLWPQNGEDVEQWIRLVGNAKIGAQ